MRHITLQHHGIMTLYRQAKKRFIHTFQVYMYRFGVVKFNNYCCLEIEQKML